MNGGILDDPAITSELGGVFETVFCKTMEVTNSPALAFDAACEQVKDSSTVIGRSMQHFDRANSHQDQDQERRSKTLSVHARVEAEHVSKYALKYRRDIADTISNVQSLFD